MKVLRLARSFAVVILLSTCAKSAADPEIISPDEIRNISNGVASAVDTSAGTGKLFLVLDESHNSRAGQIQHAIIFNRLVNRQWLSDIALEAYLFEHEAIETSWFRKAANNSLNRQVRVAVTLLKEGEISGAEFAALALPGVSLRPTERRAEYAVELDSRGKAAVAARAPRICLLKILESKGIKTAPETRAHLEKAVAAFKEVESSGDDATIAKRRKDVADALDAGYSEMIAQDAWAKKLAVERGRLTRLSDDVKSAREIRERAKQLGICADPELAAGLETYIEFFGARDAATLTIVTSARKISQASSAPVVAVVLGAGHSADAAQLMRDQAQPFVVLRPNALTTGLDLNAAEDIDAELYARKTERRSLYSEGLSKSLDANYATKDKKPEPVIQEAWFQAKAELYLYADRLAETILGGGKPPGGPPGGGPPRSLAVPGDDFDGRRVRIETDKIIVGAEPREGARFYYLNETALLSLGNVLTEEELRKLRGARPVPMRSEAELETLLRREIGTERATELIPKVRSAASVAGIPTILVPFVFKRTDGKTSETKWMKMGRSREDVASQEREDVEAMLQRALREVQEGRRLSRKKVEDDSGRVQVTAETIVAFGNSEAEAKAVALNSV
jgi:hypothetical protein